jgi:putative tryptophan/tyrosine transport system substrate-binding protein
MSRQSARETCTVNPNSKILIGFGAAAPCRSRTIVAGICIAIAAAGLLSAPSAAVGQTTAKIYRIGWLGYGSVPAGGNRNVGDFQQGLRDAGYVERKNLAIEYRYASNNPEQLASLAAELIRMPVDVIVTSGEPAALAAKRATSTIPIIMTEIGMDPVKAGLVASLGRPGGNVTGLASLSNDLWQKRLALLREFAPKASRVAVLWNPANPGNADCVAEIKAAAPSLGMQPRYLEVTNANALEGAFASIAKEPADALVMCLDSVTLERAGPIADFASKRRLPTLAPLKEYVQAGGLVSLGAKLADQRRRAAYYVDRILKGARPADLPIERPTLFELVVNVTTAKAIGFAVPATFMLLADELIE